jgi:hypothetical protein
VGGSQQETLFRETEMLYSDWGSCYTPKLKIGRLYYM